ncbi:MAG: GAF domain-containing protein [Anaerolineae bacterium]|nr:GAF domain-containing protein [Anaerolineae bacterium]
MNQPEERLKILYIDDTPDARLLVKRLLSSYYTFLEAADGLAGIDLAVEVKPDLVLVDLHMPKFSGYEVATRITALLPDVPVIALTADVTQNVRERVLASGCSGYIAKPIDVDTFVTQVDAFLEGKREELEDNSYREHYQQQLVAQLEEKVRELSEALNENALLNQENIHLLENAQRRTRLLEASARVGKSVTSILDINDLLQSTVEIIGEEFGFYYVGVFLIDEEGEWAELRAGLGDAGRAMLEEGHKLKVNGLSMIGAATGRRLARIALDVGEEAVHFKNPHLPLTRSEMALPLIAHDDVIGAITVQSVEEAAFSQEDVTVLQAVADQLAVAIHNARLVTQNQHFLNQRTRRARLLSAAAEVGRSVTSILDLDKLLNKTVDIICDAYGFYYAGVFLMDEGNEWAVLRAGRGKAGKAMVTAGHKLKIGGLSMIGMAIIERRARIALDVGDEPVHFKNPHLPLTRSEMALPLLVGDKVIGAVTIQSTEEAAFSDDDITSLQSMADQLAIAIDNARLLHDLEEAHSELVRTKTFEAIATATGEAIHWVGNKAAPIPASVQRVSEDIVRYIVMANCLVDVLPEEFQEHKFAQMLRFALDDITSHDFGFAVQEIRETLESRSLRRLRRVLNLESIFEDLDIIDKSSRAILNIKEDLIGPARQKKLQTINMPDLLTETVKTMGIPKNLVTFDFAADLKPVEADPAQLNRVFINLIKNAMEAMYQLDKPHLKLAVHYDEDPRFIVADVTDSGVGIPPEEIDKIWVAFYTTKGDRGGTGLGLPACAKIVGQLGGKITVQSEIGVGTTFSIHLPVTDIVVESVDAE